MLGEDLTRLVRSIVEETIGARRPGIAYATVQSLNAGGCTLQYTGLNLSDTTIQARIAAPMAGPGRGAFFRPEVGDEVLVAFEDGDISEPVVIGAAWNPDQTEPDVADTSAANNMRAIVSRAGHSLQFDDSPGAGGVVITTSGGSKIEIDGATGNITITTTGNVASSRITLDGISWNHQHATGVGPSGPPVSILVGG